MAFAASELVSKHKDVGEKLAIASHGFADHPGPDPATEVVHPGEDGQIVVVRSRVVETVGHVLGNMFQRMYHLIDVSGETDAATATGLRGNARALEDFLQQVLDYFSPVSLVLQYISAADVAQGLARQLSDTLGCTVKVDAKLPAEGQLLADPGRLARAFSLLASRLRDTASTNQGVPIRVVGESHGRFVHLTVVVPAMLVSPESSESEVRWAVAEKLLETHGGSLRPHATSSGEVLWEIALPLQP
jgi:hypothetical protein